MKAPFSTWRWHGARRLPKLYEVAPYILRVHAFDQLDYGITALAVPISSPGGVTMAALDSSGYTGMVTPEQMVAEGLTKLRIAALRIAESVVRYPVLTFALFRKPRDKD